MQRKNSFRVTYQGSGVSPLGCIEIAAFVEDSSGLDLSVMRKLGCYALVYIQDGGGVYRDPNGDQLVNSGDLLLLFPDHPHSYAALDNGHWNDYFILFNGPVFDLWLESGVFSVERPVLHLEPIKSWLARLEHVVAAGNPLEQVCQLQHFLADALRLDVHNNWFEKEAEWLLHAKTMLEPEEGLQRDAAEVAKTLGISYESFRKKFKALAGVPPAKYQISRRIELAAKMLLETDLTLAAIASQLDFCDEFYFSRRFKELNGLSPGAFRRRLRAPM